MKFTHAILITSTKDVLRSNVDNKPILFEDFNSAYQWADAGEKAVQIDKLPVKIRKEIQDTA